VDYVFLEFNMKKFLILTTFVCGGSFGLNALANKVEKFPVYAGIGGRISKDVAQIYTMDFPESPQNEACFRTKNGNNYCVHNTWVEISRTDANHCLMYVYDGLIDLISYEKRQIKKGDLIGYVDDAKKAKPQIIEGC
jgi:hypothetical protein